MRRTPAGACILSSRSQVQEPGAEASAPSPGGMLDAHRGHVLDSVLSICSVTVNLTAAQQLALSVGGKQAPRGTVTGSRPPRVTARNHIPDLRRPPALCTVPLGRGGSRRDKAICGPEALTSMR